MRHAGDGPVTKLGSSDYLQAAKRVSVVLLPCSNRNVGLVLSYGPTQNRCMSVDETRLTGEAIAVLSRRPV